MQLVLNSHGLTLRKENNVFIISTLEGQQRIPADQVRSILVHPSAAVTSDAIMLAIQNSIDVIFIDSRGKPHGRVWSVQYGSISTIRQKQVEFLYSQEAVTFIKELLIEKLDNQITVLLAFKPDDRSPDDRRIQSVINSLEDYKKKIHSAQATHISDIAPTLRGWEGVAGRRYFEAVSLLLPTQWRFEQRSQHPAFDPFNCALNYGYGILYGKVEGALIKAGIDPYMGIYHRDDYNRPALVFDIIEKYRYWIDYVVITLFRANAFFDECFRIENQREYLLDGIGKRILIQSVNDYLAEIITQGNLERSRSTHLENYAHALAQKFLKFSQT